MRTFLLCVVFLLTWNDTLFSEDLLQSWAEKATKLNKEVNADAYKLHQTSQPALTPKPGASGTPGTATAQQNGGFFSAADDFNENIDGADARFLGEFDENLPPFSQTDQGYSEWPNGQQPYGSAEPPPDGSNQPGQLENNLPGVGGWW